MKSAGRLNKSFITGFSDMLRLPGYYFSIFTFRTSDSKRRISVYSTGIKVFSCYTEGSGAVRGLSNEYVNHRMALTPCIDFRRWKFQLGSSVMSKLFEMYQRSRNERCDGN